MSIQDNHDQQGYTAPGASTGYEPVNGTNYDPAGAVPPPPPPPFAYPPPPGTHVPNPLLAGLLGFIPGVGAMYNGQFAKGLANIAIFAIFVSLSNHVSDMFGLFVAGWEFYMAFEAYQTAAARRDGRPLPDPFGLNNIGERFGFQPQAHPDLNNAWERTVGRMPGAAPAMEESRYDAATGTSYYSRTDAAGNTSSYQVDPAGNVYTQNTQVPPTPGYVPPAPGYAPPYDPAASYGVPPGYGVPPVPPVPPMPPTPPKQMIPAGAFWLIGLGVFALLGSLRPFSGLEGEATGGLFLMGLGAFLIYRRHTALQYIYPEGSPALAWNNMSAYRGAAIVLVLGVLVFLQGLHVLHGNTFGAVFLIALGGLLLAERVTQNNAMNSYPGYPGYPGQPPVPPAEEEQPAAKDEPVSIVPKYTRPDNDLSIHNDEEGR
jgi:TM2 domain-containing membrane protein YozV